MRGGDNQAGFAIRNPHGALVLPYVWKSNAEFEENHVQFGGQLGCHYIDTENDILMESLNLIWFCLLQDITKCVLTILFLASPPNS